MINNRLKSHILEVVENQLRMNDPKCTRETLNRLVGLGFEEVESKEMIAAVLVEEMYYTMKDNKPFNEQSYAEKLTLLPDYSEEDTKKTRMPVKDKPTVGRNEPCPCGSGKKYKKCCGK